MNSVFTTTIGRRSFLAATAMTGVAITAACTRSAHPAGAPAASLNPNAITAAERARPHTGKTVRASLIAKESVVDLGNGVHAKTLTCNDTVPGPTLRANVGDEFVITVKNEMSRATSMHWHGIALRNDMDGAAPATPDIEPGATFTYQFSVPHPGTYWAHPHVGMDTDYGLYLPLIVDDPADAGDYDAEWIVVLDDWTSGVGKSPDEILDGLKSMGHDMGGMDHGNMGHGDTGHGDMGHGDMGHGDMGGMDMGDMPMNSSDLMGGDAGDVTYPHFLINGRVDAAPSVLTAKPGQRLRLRIINAAADTAFRVGLGGHVMTLTHTDGFPIKPVRADSVLLGMGERYDAIVTVGDGVFPLVAQPEGKDGKASALLTSSPTHNLAEVGAGPDMSSPVTAYRLSAADSVALPDRTPDVELAVQLTGTMMNYDWAINGQSYPDITPLTVKQGQSVRLKITNHSSMWHPMHLHGHTFALRHPDGSAGGARKDTVNVLPHTTVEVDLIADNPGAWMLHCHNGYHMDAGMMSRLDVQ